MRSRRHGSSKQFLFASLRSLGDASHTAAMFAALAASIVAAAILMTMATDPGRFAHLRPEQIALYAVEDSLPQRRAYLAFLAILAVGALTAGWWEHRVGHLRAPTASVIALAVLTPIVTTPHGIVVLMTGAFIVALMTWSGLLARITALLVLGFFIAPIVLRPAVPDPAIFAWIDMHYAAVLSHGQRIASGLKPFTETLPGYGLLPALAMSMIPQGVSFGAMVHLVQWSQVIFACLLIMAIRVATAPGHTHLFWSASAITLLALVPFLSTNAVAIWFPNQTGLRFVMLPIAMLAVLLTIRGPNAQAAVAFGTIGGLSLVHNLETGLMISVALGATLVARLGQAPVRIVVVAGVQALTAAVVVLGLTAAFVVLRTGAGSEELVAPLLALFNLFLGGFGGMRLRLTPAFVLILLHSACIVCPLSNALRQ
ncbi:hypothetical protein [Sphingomonas sp.]|uniref:hypothetical protein n=1 Tax=Sphingomonas sp. TaxID=28214 RepID=UPI0035B3AF03